MDRDLAGAVGLGGFVGIAAAGGGAVGFALSCWQSGRGTDVGYIPAKLLGCLVEGRLFAGVCQFQPGGVGRYCPANHNFGISRVCDRSASLLWEKSHSVGDSGNPSDSVSNAGDPNLPRLKVGTPD